MSNPKISIIVPVYKVEKYLDRCIESIVNQTYKSLEIILVDDGSPDNCPKMCDEWAKKDGRIKVIHKENGGVANARNYALKRATGDYIGFVDGDDYIEFDLFETLINNALENECDISICGYQINNEGNPSSNVRKTTKTDALRQIAAGDYKYGVLWNKLYKKSVIENLEMPNFVCCEDLVFNYYAFKNSSSVVECDDKLYHYMQNEDSITKDVFHIGAFDAVYARKIILENEQGTELEEYAVRGLISSCFVVLSGVIQNNKCMDKYDYLRDIILRYKRTIMKSPLYSKKDRIKVQALSVSKKLFNEMIKRSHS